MSRAFKKHTVAESVLLLVWIVMVMTEITIPVGSQSCVQPGYRKPIPQESWPPNAGSVIVKIDGLFSTFSDDATYRLAEGNEKWNSPLNCSGVTFVDFETVLFSEAEYADAAPFHQIYWQVDNIDTPYNAGVVLNLGFAQFVESANIKVKPGIVLPDHNPIYFNYLGSHEVGHTFDLNDCTSATIPTCSIGGLSIMGANTNTIFDSQGPTTCDFEALKPIYCPPTPTPTPTPGTCNGVTDFTTYPTTGCSTGFVNNGGICDRSDAFKGRCNDPTGYDPDGCWCPDGINTSPIIIDVDGSGFSTTNASGGVIFNILNDGVPLQMAWTAASSTNAFLVLDRNGNGLIDSGAELFGNITPQPASAAPNGFLALAEYDKPSNGGNRDGRIDRHDAIFSQLGLWQDVNHDAISEPNELRPLLGFLSAIDLDYEESRRTDQYGNQFRYRSRVFDVHGTQAGRWAWDVFFKVR